MRRAGASRSLPTSESARTQSISSVPGRATLTVAQRGSPPIEATSEVLAAIAFQPRS